MGSPQKSLIPSSPTLKPPQLTTMASASLIYSTLFLLLAQLTHSAPQPSTIYIIHVNHLAKPTQASTLEQWYTSLAATHSPRGEITSRRILYIYDTVMHGFAVQLTGDEARRMSNAPGVTGVYEDRVLRLLTTRSPGFLGLDPGFGAWKDTNFGDGVIIGFVDSGIWPESRSFNDSGLVPVRPSWKGRCVDAKDFNASLCNNKPIGARTFIAATEAMGNNGVPSPRDKDGHGTHVASTAAGSEVHDIGFLGFARGTARGVAPKARIAMYQVTDSDTPTADVVAAIDAAVKDGVDIISMSIGYYQFYLFHDDILAIAAFGAERKGVFVVVAGGNSGPQASSVINVAPWMTTVAAATVDRLFPASLNLADGTVLTGPSLYAMKYGSTMVPLLTISCINHPLTPAKIRGSIVMCVDGWATGDEVRAAGGVGRIIIDKGSWYRDGTEAMEFDSPTVYLSRTDGDKFMSYVASSAYPLGSLKFTCETVIGKNRAPMVVKFSSRGPNPVVPELLKPDVVAPGQNILAAWFGDYMMQSGTSMACPHVAGVAALIKKKHTDWTPAMIRSALMTTAATIDNTGQEIVDNAVTDISRGAMAATPFATGAGHVRPDLALDPGLVYDAGERDYIDFLCSLNYTKKQLSLFASDMATCKRTALPGGPADFNYPSFVVVFDNGTNVRTLTRTVTKVSQNTERYSVTYMVPERVKVNVTPMTLEFTKQNEKKSYTVQFRSLAGRSVTPGWDFGHISWESKDHLVRSPVAFQWKN